MNRAILRIVWRDLAAIFRMIGLGALVCGGSFAVVGFVRARMGLALYSEQHIAITIAVAVGASVCIPLSVSILSSIASTYTKSVRKRAKKLAFKTKLRERVAGSLSPAEVPDAEGALSECTKETLP